MKQAIVFSAFVAASVTAALHSYAAEPATEVAAPAPTTAVAPDPERFADDIRNFAARDRKNFYPRDGVLFVGSSSIRNWLTAESFPDMPVINRGFGGSQISDVNHYFNDVVAKYRPKLIVFYSGDNDTQAGKSPQLIFSDFDRFVSRVHDSLPDTHIIALPIKPSIARWTKWPQMQETNSRMAELDKRDDRLQIVDTATPLLGPDGQPRKELYVADGLHLSPKGYAVWNEILTPILKKSLAARQ
jgi:lysophospholipase L1-like esterase